jgi:hypothetical protein
MCIFLLFLGRQGLIQHAQWYQIFLGAPDGKSLYDGGRYGTTHPHPIESLHLRGHNMAFTPIGTRTFLEHPMANRYMTVVDTAAI